jgi:hypothetical protein
MFLAGEDDRILSSTSFISIGIADFHGESFLTLCEDVPIGTAAPPSLPLLFCHATFPSKDPSASDPDQGSNLHVI